MKRPHFVRFGLLIIWIAVLSALAAPLITHAQVPQPAPDSNATPDVVVPPPVVISGDKVNNDLVTKATSDLATLTGTQRTACVKKLWAALSSVRAKLRTTEKEKTATTVDAGKKKELEQKAEDLTRLESALVDLLNKEDPDDLRIDFYAATVSSTLFHQEGSSGLFGTAKPYLEARIAQTFSRAGSNGGWDFWGTITTQTAAFAPKPAPAAEAKSPASERQMRTTSNGGFAESIQSFTVEAGSEHGIPTWVHNNNVRLAVFWGISLSSFESTVGDTDLRPQDRDSFRAGGRAGIVFRQTAGSWRGTLSEFSYSRDPRFKKADRLLVRGRVVLTPLSGEGEGLGVYLEGSINAGRGRDEARLAIGVRLDTLAILRAIVGGKTSTAPG